MNIEKTDLFPHKGRSDLQSGDFIAPHMVTDQAQSVALRQRFTPAIQCAGGFLGQGSTKLMFMLPDTHTEFLCILEYQVRTFSLTALQAGFGIFSNPNIRQVIHWGFVDLAQWQITNGPLGYANPVTVSNYQRQVISGQFDTRLITPGQAVFAFLQIDLSGLLPVQFAGQDFAHPETGELLPIGVHGVSLYTRES